MHCAVLRVAAIFPQKFEVAIDRVAARVPPAAPSRVLSTLLTCTQPSEILSELLYSRRGSGAEKGWH